MVGNPKWPFSGGDGDETNFRHVGVFILLALFFMVLAFGFALTNRLGIFSPTDW